MCYQGVKSKILSKKDSFEVDEIGRVASAQYRRKIGFSDDFLVPTV
jgi:hypothetical protein